MPPEIQQPDPVEEAIDAQESQDPAPVDVPPDYIRNSPEYQALLRQNRQLARESGRYKTEAQKARERAESLRLAAEATKQASVEQEIETILGEEGVAFWSEFAELSQSDPREAARRLAAFRQQAAAQSPVEPATTLRPAAAERDEEVAQMTAPVSPRAVGDAPLGQRTDDTTQLITSLEEEYNTVVRRNLDPATRNRVTMKDRANGLIAYLLAAYTKAGAKPKGG